MFDISRFLTEGKSTTYSRLNEADENLFAMEKIVDGAGINRWKLEVEKMVGSWGWHNPDLNLVVYATPNWENSQGIPLSITNIETGDYKNVGSLTFRKTGDPRKDAKHYLQLIAGWLRRNRKLIDAFGSNARGNR